MEKKSRNIRRQLQGPERKQRSKNEHCFLPDAKSTPGFVSRALAAHTMKATPSVREVWGVGLQTLNPK